VSIHAPVVASVSGGKDSTALCLHLREQGTPYRAVHMDTGWEHPLTDAYLRDVLEPAIGPIEWLVPPRGFADLVRHKGIFPSRKKRFCTEHLKIFPLMAWMADQYPHDDVLNAVGIRAAESQARAGLEEYEDTSWATTWRPLLQWSEADVIEIHRRHNLPPNPLYLPPYNMTRVGCWPCLFARKEEVAAIARLDPRRIDAIRELEREMRALPQHTARLDAAEGPLRWVPTFAVARRPDGSGGHVTQSISIDDLVAWAQTARGGQQMQFWLDDDRSGCMRWGVCDT